MRLLRYLLAAALALAPLPNVNAAGWVPLAASAGGGTSPTLDANASAKNEVNGSTGSTVATISTTSSNDIIIVFILYNGAVSITSVTSTSSLTFTQRSTTTLGSSHIEMWYAIAASPLTSEAITVGGTASFTTVTAFAVSGGKVSAPFDSGASVTSLTDPVSITTTHANTMVVAGARLSSSSSSTAGTGFTLVSSAGNFAVTEYKTSVPIGTLSATLGSAAGDSNGMIVDALVPGP